MFVPAAMVEAPRLDPMLRVGPPARKHALLINPFYPKDPHASYGKHVLTPSLALTSIAGSTPADWSVRYRDENDRMDRGEPARVRHLSHPHTVSRHLRLRGIGQLLSVDSWVKPDQLFLGK